MQNNNAPQNEEVDTASQRKICFFICIYFLLISTTRMTAGGQSDRLANIKTMLNSNGNFKLRDLFSSEQMYDGTWRSYEGQGSEDTVVGGKGEQLNVNGTQVVNPDFRLFLTESAGKFRMYVDRPQIITTVENKRQTVQHFQLEFFNGQYVDQGTLFYNILLNYDFVEYSFIQEKTQGSLFYNSSKGEMEAWFREEKIFRTIDDGMMKLSGLNVTAEVDRNNQLIMTISVENDKLNVSLGDINVESQWFANLIFVVLMILSSCLSFSSILSILRSVLQLQDNPRNYSFVTVIFTNMWDTTLCLVCFILAFKDQLSLMFYIMPAFVYCLIFTNLQPRLLISIFQAAMDNDMNIRRALCKFNIYHYTSLFAIYPLLLLTNFNWVLFILMSCIVFPQIYANGFNNTRPDVSSVYYTRYLFSRFLIIIYLKCYPGNIFFLEPDYVLGMICFALVSIQYVLLVVQKTYGSKKILPSFLLEPVYDYFLQEQLNVEEVNDSNECSICLTSLSVEPPKDASELDVEPSARLMRTPCNHHYHSHCLLVWMKIKMECPQCRYKLPPYE